MEEAGFSEEVQEYAERADDHPSTVVRSNLEKFPGAPSGHRIPWCEEAFFLPERPRFDHDPLFHVGAYYVQEASSTVIGSLVREEFRGQEAPLKVLDLCAAPGGKSTHLASVLPEGSLLVSNDTIGKRIPTLIEQMRKWGSPNTIITQADPERFARKLPESFDLILVDAPCSGEGLFRKMPEHRKEWGAGLVEHSAMRQTRIVNDAWSSLKEGGLLLYCTCTLNRKENEEVLAPLVAGGKGGSKKAKGVDLSGWKKEERSGVLGYRSWPQNTGGEGFFFALLEKRKGDGEGFGPLETPLSKKNKKGLSALSSSLRAMLRSPDRWHGETDQEGHMMIFDAPLYDPVQQLEARIPIKWKGTWTASRKGQDLIPSPDLAFSPILNEKAYPMVDLDGTDALRFIARDKLSPDLFPEGFCGVRYEDVPLGWVKNVGDRVNGHFPKRWRLTGYDGGGVVDLRRL
jgi:16S rRNA C967 or C1407 C5-methylase (RsmB/RsmF family)